MNGRRIDSHAGRASRAAVEHTPRWVYPNNNPARGGLGSNTNNYFSSLHCETYCVLRLHLRASAKERGNGQDGAIADTGRMPPANVEHTAVPEVCYE